MAYISFTMGRILIKLGENVGTSVRLIIFKFNKKSVLCCCSYDVIPIFKKLFLREAALYKGKQSCCARL